MSRAKTKTKTRLSPRTADATDVYVGERVRELRRANNMSLDALSKSVRLSQQQLQKYEIGMNRISAGRLFQLAQVFDVPVADFFPS